MPPRRLGRLSLLDLVDEAIAGLLMRPGRTALTILGSVVGMAAIIATIGIAQSSEDRILSRFEEFGGSFVIVGRTSPDSSTVLDLASDVIPSDADARLSHVEGIEAVGLLSVVDLGSGTVESGLVGNTAGQSEFQLPVVAATPEIFAAARASIREGRLFDAGHSSRGDRVAVVGSRAATRLHIHSLEGQPAIFVEGIPLVVIGLLENVGDQERLLDSIIVPSGTAAKAFGTVGVDEVVIRTSPGAATDVGRRVATTLSPNNPSALEVRVPREPIAVRSAISGDLDTLIFVLAGLALLTGAIGIANVMLVAVLERVSEIGVRRSLGATRAQIAMQFLLEAALIGLIGGVVASSLGLVTVVGVSAVRGWTPTMDSWVPLVTPIAGVFEGLVAGLLPARRAASLHPMEALRTTG
ncbi:MAG TPA: ABC transporter permease [Acidimicrobiia bacterium]|nr:ABC transporter permease [Acidimicrobiia bacterium]